MRYFVCVAFLLLYTVLLSGCGDRKRFSKVSSSHSGITFVNEIAESDTFNIIDIENLYNGGGVGIGDFNNDGLPDVYFTGNRVANRLYLNKGDLQFEDVTAEAGAEGEGKWSRGVSIVDINGDGWQDIYVSTTLLLDSAKRENILYINQGLNAEGVPTFKNRAREYGLNDNSHTTQSAFFDYDNDGDLDVYLAVNVFAPHDNPNTYRPIARNGEHLNTDRLYENRWDSTRHHPVFTNVSRKAGILQEGYAHSVTVCDINQDGWKDLYVTNDYLSENLFYLNNGNGTFSNRSKAMLKHTSFNAMGADVVDINNDGLSDVIELDMNPEDNYRKKTMLGPGSYQSYAYNQTYNYQFQYIRNTLQLNRGCCSDTATCPVFSEIGFYAGISETDWSWTPLVADFDNDGFRDIIITNGFPKDITDQDFMAFRNSAFALNDKAKLLAQIPEVKIANYAYRNTGGLRFDDVTEEWGLDVPTFSNGAATADFDGDGDLDVIISNINDEALLYENTTEKSNFLQIKLAGNKANPGGFGTTVRLYMAGGLQVYETNPVRGYLSSVQNLVSFGLGDRQSVDSLLVIWPNGKAQKLTGLKANQTLTVRQQDAKVPFSWTQNQTTNAWFEDATAQTGLVYRDRQNDAYDYRVQRTMLHKFSQGGPPMAVGDVNNDGTEDLVIGSANGRPETVFLQQRDGRFSSRKIASETDTLQPVLDTGLALFDADNDHDLDLYVAVGGYEAPAGSPAYQDRFYENDGQGNFTRNKTALPPNFSSNSVVKTADVDHDGDLDLFVGGRVSPWQYPRPVSSFLLRNDSKTGSVRFTDITPQMAPVLQNIGLVTDALWSDYDHDSWPDLVLVGEWMPVTVIRNDRGRLRQKLEIEGKKGFWNSIAEADLDHDGDPDYVAGNMGENSFYSNSHERPVINYSSDFDGNGNFESIPTRLIKTSGGGSQYFPAHSRNEIVEQLPAIKKNFLSYSSFAKADLEELVTREALDKALISEANYFQSCVIENRGKGQFSTRPLPRESQFSAVFGLKLMDVNGDGHTDIVLTGNDYGMEVFNGRLDAGYGLLLLGDGKLGFRPVLLRQAGLTVADDARCLVSMKTPGHKTILVASQCNGYLKAFQTHQ